MTALLPELAIALEAGSQVLTASPRAARALTRAYVDHARSQGRTSWLTPRIDTWDAWVEQLYETFAVSTPLPLLLTPLQEEQLWLQVLSDDPAASTVVAPGRLAQLAQSGYARLGTYNAHTLLQASAHHDTESNPDALHFLAWSQAFERRCRQLDVFSRSRVEESLVRLLQRSAQQGGRFSKDVLPAQIWLVGFDRLTPAQLSLEIALKAAGISVHTAGARPLAATRRIYQTTDPRHEREACALWIRNHLMADPSMRIGVLVPELSGQRAAIERTFRRILLPTSAQMPAGGEMPYEFSLGDPLANVPVIAVALQLLAWVGTPAATVSAAVITNILTCGLLAASAAEALALAQADVLLRREGLLTPSVSLGTLLKQLERRPNLLPQTFTQRLRLALATSLPLMRSPRLPGEWLPQVLRVLEAFGWPGYQPLASLPYQARQRWLTLLEQLSLLDFTGERMTWSAFVDVVARATRQTLFTAETRGAPVQILGAAEAAGLSFDALWFMHAQEDTWPAPGRLHPLLIPTLQQQAGMPHARHDLDQQLAQAQMLRIAASVHAQQPRAEAICSYSTQVDGAEARPSQLLRLFSATAAEALPTALEGAGVPVPAFAVELGSEPARVAAWPTARPAGGSELLKRQAACGFQSFAVKRLKAEAIEQEAWGLDDRERATLLHAALQHLWKPASETDVERKGETVTLLHTQDDLLVARSNGTLHEAVDAAIDAAISGRASDAAGDPWLLAYLRSERMRLRTRILAWLEVEANRAEFAVEAVEQDLRNVQVGPLILNLRVDRIDAVEAETQENSGLLLIDYKTASTLSTSAWDGERPDEPQLPIYALYGISATTTNTLEPVRPVVGIAFAQVHPGKDKLMGRARNPEMQLSPRMKEKAASVATLHDSTIAAWGTALTALAMDFSQGVALVDPKKGATTCRLCGLQGICRVSALDLEPEDEEDAENDLLGNTGIAQGRGTLAG